MRAKSEAGEAGLSVLRATKGSGLKAEALAGACEHAASGGVLLSQLALLGDKAFEPGGAGICPRWCGRR